MATVTIPQEWVALCASTDSAVIHECINSVFRRLLANLLLDFQNPKYRQVKKTNKALHRLTNSLPNGFVRYLFNTLGFMEHADTFDFQGTAESLKHADEVFSQLENLMDKEAMDAAKYELSQLKVLAAKKAASPSSVPAPSPPVTVKSSIAKGKECGREGGLNCQQEDTQKDMEEGKLVEEAVRKTLLNTGRIRNSFFEAKDLTIRTMRHGRVYACTEKCDNECIEVHWHLLTGKNILYSHLAHLSADGTNLLHLGVEHGYQYNTLPGSQHFGKMLHFSEKLTDEHGKLIRLKHDDKPVSACIYCGRLFSELLL
ncbi:hypothetical protein ABB37_06980 [Leptomonas pyrrhocoris]|uniref:PUB domain-containing protein n=1 Tax=Leptomonas pyrrhocoris TaxID=157538 RepID=A0A0N0VE85_LEPPY|nr:hypothetical protein ABB37_06980 [Leptomonas pyrrhocoris]KPA77621.1 hypothetical protein ABB37_06980 [Leptomonas pyrrhocoris]|eukprot:XP_015656060.1 hypothetical protein ABB37_06980 [Leptomonas pyrrhocoris]